MDARRGLKERVMTKLNLRALENELLFVFFPAVAFCLFLYLTK
jgi:hypothetical protein